MDSQGTRPKVIDHMVMVTAIHEVSPRYRRLTMDSQGLFEFFTPQPAGYLMINLTDRGSKAQRAYTIHGTTASSFLLDFVIHDPAGPGSQWARQATLGTQVSVTEPLYHVDIPSSSHALIIADTSALPAAATIVQAFTENVTVILINDDPDLDTSVLFPGIFDSNPNQANTKKTVVFHQVPELSTDILRSTTATLTPHDCFLWAAGERNQAKTVREYARQEFQVPRTNQHIQTYWISQN